mgnify:CR=1 FL=1
MCIRYRPSASDPLVMRTIMDKAVHFSGRLIEGIDALSEEIDTYTHFRAHETKAKHVCRLLPETKKQNQDETAETKSERPKTIADIQ